MTKNAEKDETIAKLRTALDDIWNVATDQLTTDRAAVGWIEVRSRAALAETEPKP